MRIGQNRCYLMICSCALASLMYIHATTAFHLIFASPRGKVQSSFFYFILTQNILKAERWAKEHGLPFPQIDGNPVLENPDIQECYVFEDQSDPECPTILHFPLTNKTFRDFSAPGKKHYSVTYIYIYIVRQILPFVRSKVFMTGHVTERFRLVKSPISKKLFL